MSNTKVCTGCKVEKLLSGFYKQTDKKDGLRSRCKSCEVTARQTTHRRSQHRKGAKKYYHKNKKRLQTYQKEHYKKKKKEIGIIRDWVKIHYEGTPCMDCGNVFEWCAMDFDHRPDKIKLEAVGNIGGRLATNKYIDMVKKEIAKCDLVCSNCHRVRTWITRKK